MRIAAVVETEEFERRAAALMSDEERMGVIDAIARDPGAGVAIGGGIRKLRFARKGGGKSGGYRTIHYFGGDLSTPVFLLTVFAKNEKANLTPVETATLRKLAGILAGNYGRAS